MVKRFLCLVTTLVFLTGSAVCEGAYQASITFDYSQEAATVAAKQLTDDQAQLGALAQALVELVEGFDIQLTVQESGARFAMNMQDFTLFDFTVFGTETEGFVLSNLLPEHYAYASVSQEEADMSMQAAEQLAKTDWTSVLEQCSTELTSWLEYAYAGQDVGNFMGDAYEGGARRLTFAFDDSSIASLLDGMIGILADHGIDDSLLNAWVGAEGLLSSFAAYNGEIASANEYNYTLYIVLDENYSIIGMSLLTMKADEQVMTLSVGIGDNGFHVVWGYGLNQENIYIDFVFIDGQTETEKDFSLTVYKDPYREGFRAVEPYLDYMQMLYSGTVGFSDTAGGASWYADVECFSAGASEPDEWCVVRGEYFSEVQTIDQTFSWYLSNEEGAEPAEVMHFSFAPCEPVTVSLDGLTALDVEDASLDSQFSTLMIDAIDDLAIDLFKMVPAPLLTYFMQ